MFKDYEVTVRVVGRFVDEVEAINTISKLLEPLPIRIDKVRELKERVVEVG
jgi:hypothetical protein